MTGAIVSLSQSGTVEGSRRFARYENAVATEMPFIKKLPSHWRVEKLKHVASVRFSSVDKKSEDGETPVRLCNYTDVYNRDIIIDDPDFMQATASKAEIDRFTLMRGDVLITKDSETWNDIAVPAFVSADMPGVLCGYHLALIRPYQDEINGAFLSRAFAADGIRQQFHIAANGITRYGLPNRAIAGALFPIPPLDEQLAIATFLDRETGKIDELISRKLTFIDRLEEKRAAIISHATIRGLDPDVQLQSVKCEWLKHLPSHWRFVPLKLAARRGYKTFTDGDWIESPFITNAGVRLIQTGNIGIGAYREQGYRYVSEGTFFDLRCSEVFPGDILICRLDGPVGRACVVPKLAERMITSVDNTILRTSHENDARYLVYLLSSPEWLGWISSLCRVGGGFRLRVSRTMLGNFRVPLPPLDEQVRIANSLDCQTARIDRLIASVGKGVDQLRTYRSALISSAVTGKLDIRIWSEDAQCP
jgi:type I restriction enzyme, S subunit